MKRRSFLSLLSMATLAAISAPISAFSSSSCDAITIKMVGDLDDDLFVVRASMNDWEIEECYQMHNPTKNFSLEGKTFTSVHSPGYIEFNKDFMLEDGEVLLIGLANEREERDDKKALIARTHYKSVPLHVNNMEVIGSMIPEFNDLSDAPTWYNPDEDAAVYNYYRAWENSLVNIALIFPLEGNYTLSFANEGGSVIAQKTFHVSKSVLNARFEKTIHGPIDEHPMAEIDGGVFLVEGKRMPVDEDVIRLCPNQVLITSESGDMIRIPLPYPFPYINRVFCIAK